MAKTNFRCPDDVWAWVKDEAYSERVSANAYILRLIDNARRRKRAGAKQPVSGANGYREGNAA